MDNRSSANPYQSSLRQTHSKSVLRRHWVIIALIVASLLIRFVYFAELIKSPCYWQFLWVQSDMNFFHSWARELVSGDWLINKPLHPYHAWHDRVANSYFRSLEQQSPKLQENQPAIDYDTDAKRQLWNRWYGEKRYHQEPLYPYLLAVVYKLFGVRVALVYLFQLSIGILNILLIYSITQRFFDPRIAAIAGLLAVLCGPLLFLEMVLLRSTLISFFGLFLVWLVPHSAESMLSWGRLGLVVGLGVLLKSTFLFFLVGIMALLILRYRHSARRALTYASALIAGVAISLTPLLVRNVAVGTSPFGLSSVTAVTLLSANAGDSHPDGFFVTKHVATIMDRTNGAVLPTIIETLKTHSFVSYAKLLWHKFKLLWHWYEIPNNTNFYYFRLHSYVLRSLPVTFLLVAPLSIVGIVLTICERERCVPLYLLFVMHVVSILLVYVAARFRVPLLAASLPFAAVTMARIADGLRKRVVAKTLLICVSIIVVSFWTMRPLPKRVSLIRTADCRAAYRFYYEPRLFAAQTQGNVNDVLSIHAALLRSEPPSIRRLSPASPPRNKSDRDTALLFSQFREMYASVLVQAGRNEEARIIEQRAKALRAFSNM